MSTRVRTKNKEASTNKQDHEMGFYPALLAECDVISSLREISMIARGGIPPSCGSPSSTAPQDRLHNRVGFVLEYIYSIQVVRRD
jgi:hypothetical protein